MSITEERLADIELRLNDIVEMDKNGYERAGWLRLKPAIPALFDVLAELRATREQRDGAIRLNDTYQQDCNDLAAQVAALTSERGRWLEQRDDLYGWLARWQPEQDAMRARAEAAEAWAAALRAALERAKAFLLLARHPDLLGVLDAYSTIVDALAATTPAPAEPPIGEEG